MSSLSDRQRRKATLCVFLASLCFSTGGLFIKMIPWGALAINGARNLIGACVIGVFLLYTRHRIIVNRTVIIGALSLVSVTTLYALANKMTTAANTIVLQYTAPVFVILFMAMIFHSGPSRTDVVTCAAVLFGVCLFFIDGMQSGGTAGNILALLSGICYAGVFMMNTGRNADAISSSFLGQLTAGVCFTPFSAFESDFSAQTLLMVFALGVIQVGLAYILLSAGIRYTPPVTASLITGLEPILNPIWVALFYHEAISGLALAGAFIVIGSILLYNLYRARQP